MSGHVDAESLALYAEGQLSRRRTVRVRAHLAGCAECARTAAALAEVTTRLSQVPVPPMPAAVAAQLDAALSAESARRAAGAAPAPAPADAPPPRPPRRGPLWSPRALRILAATGATLVVAGGAGYAVSQFSGSGSSGSAGAASSASSAGRTPVDHSPLAAAPAMAPGSHAPPRVPTRPQHPLPCKTGTDYRAGTLVRQTKKALAEYDMGGLSGPGVLPISNVPAGVLNCVSHVAQGHPVRLVDLARYQQRPAIVIVHGHPDTVTVVSDACHPLHSVRLPVTSGPIRSGETLKIIDPETKAPAVKESLLHPKPGVLPADGMAIDRLLASGAIVGACNVALGALSKMMAGNAGVGAADAAKEWAANIVTRNHPSSRREPGE